jgi:2-polyprenyl-3-methyl-5-hydroxy-6-metoxy-1,4-benzoquinol methylase
MIKLHKKITREKKSAFLAKQGSDGKTLDIGSGDKYYAKFFPNLTSVDIDPLRKPDVVASVYQLPFKDGEFDNILCTEVLEHLAEPAAAILEMERVLKPGGKLILTTCFIFPIHDAPGDYFRYTKYGLA